jgi:hypothetical protein
MTTNPFIETLCLEGSGELVDFDQPTASRIHFRLRLLTVFTAIGFVIQLMRINTELGAVFGFFTCAICAVHFATSTLVIAGGTSTCMAALCLGGALGSIVGFAEFAAFELYFLLAMPALLVTPQLARLRDRGQMEVRVRFTTHRLLATVIVVILVLKQFSTQSKHLSVAAIVGEYVLCYLLPLFASVGIYIDLDALNSSADCVECRRSRGIHELHDYTWKAAFGILISPIWAIFNVPRIGLHEFREWSGFLSKRF